MAYLNINPNKTAGSDNEASDTTRARWLLTEGKAER